MGDNYIILIEEQGKKNLVDGYYALFKCTGIQQEGMLKQYFPVLLFLTDEEREQVERLRWPSRGYLQELSEYQQRRRQIRKSRCSIM